MKKGLLFILTAIMLLSGVFLTSCRDDDGVDKRRTRPDGKTELIYYIWGNDEEIALTQSIIDAFEEENPDIIVTIERSGTDYYGTLQQRFGAKNAPDIFYMETGEIMPFVTQQLIEPLDSYINASGILSNENFWGINDAYKSKDQLYAIIKDWSPSFMLLYNKKHIDEYNTSRGLTEGMPGFMEYPSETIPMTWDEFYEMSSALTVKQGQTTRYGAIMDYVPYKHLMQMIQANGSTFYTADKKNFNKDDPKVKEAFEYFIKLQYDTDTNVIPPAKYTPGGNVSVGGEKFKNGQLSTVFYGSWAFKSYGFKDSDKVDVGIAPPPVPSSRVNGNERNNYAGVAGAVSHAVSARSPYKNEAYKFIEYFTLEGSKMLAESGFNIPGNKVVAENEYINATDSYYRSVNQTYFNTVSYSHVIQTNPYILESETERLLATEIGKVMSGTITLDAAMQNIYTNINSRTSAFIAIWGEK